jgi:hypothetical protein
LKYAPIVIVVVRCNDPSVGSIGGTETSWCSSYRLAGTSTVHHTSSWNSAGIGRQEKSRTDEKERGGLEHHRWWVVVTCLFFLVSVTPNNCENCEPNVVVVAVVVVVVVG